MDAAPNSGTTPAWGNREMLTSDGQDENTEESIDEDPILYSEVDRNWMSRWQAWRNNIAWRYTWLVMKIGEIERELDRLNDLESNNQELPPKNEADPVYLPAYPTFASHPFLSLQVPRKRSLQNPTILQPYKRVRSQSRNKDRPKHTHRERASKDNTVKTKKETRFSDTPEILTEKRSARRYTSSNRARIGDFHDESFPFELNNFWELPGTQNDGKGVLTFENPEIYIPPVREIEDPEVKTESEPPDEQQRNQIQNGERVNFKPQREETGLEGVLIIVNPNDIDEMDESDEEDPTDASVALMHYKLECLERYKNRPALAIFPSYDGKVTVPSEQEFLETPWRNTYTSVIPSKRVAEGEWPIGELQHYEVFVPPIPNQDDLVFVDFETSFTIGESVRNRKKARLSISRDSGGGSQDMNNKQLTTPSPPEKKKHKQKRKRDPNQVSIVDQYDWEIIQKPPNQDSVNPSSGVAASRVLYLRRTKPSVETTDLT